MSATDIPNPEPTAEAVAAWLAAVLRSHGLEARAWPLPTGWRVSGVNSDCDEEALFSANNNVFAFALSIGRTKALRKKTFRLNEFGLLGARCADIAARFKEHKANRAAQEVAIGVAATLKGLGLPAFPYQGRVEIKLDLSPGYAAEVGPKIAAIMSERKVPA